MPIVRLAIKPTLQASTLDAGTAVAVRINRHGLRQRRKMLRPGPFSRPPL